MTVQSDEFVRHGAERGIVDEGVCGRLLFICTKGVFAFNNNRYIEVMVVDSGSSMVHREFERWIKRIKVVDKLL